MNEQAAPGGGASPEQQMPHLSRPQRSAGTLPAIIGFAIAGAAILALGLWLGSRERAPAVPRLTLIAPVEGAVIERPLELVFDVAPSRMRIGPGGWGVGTLHIHAWIDEREIMPAAADIEYIGSPARYRWIIPGVEPGERTARIGWSDARHQAIAEGASDVVTVTVR